MEYSERECKEKTDPDILNSVLMLYTQEKTEMPTADLRYKQSAIKFFSYDPENRRKKHEKEYDSQAAKEKYDPGAAKEKRRQVTLKSTHMSGFQSICISCTRWGNNPNVIKTVQDIQTKFPKANNAQFFFAYRYAVQRKVVNVCYLLYSI